MVKPNHAETVAVGTFPRCRPMRNDLIKSVYITQLLELPREQVLDFWKPLPPGNGSAGPGQAALFEHIWNEAAESPKEYVAAVLGRLEKHLVENGHDARRFFDRLALRVNRGTPVPGRVLLMWLGPFLQRLFFSRDLRAVVLEMMVCSSDKFIPGSARHIAASRREAGWNEVDMVFAPDREHFVVWPFHSELVSIALTRNAPRVFGLLPFEEVTVLAETGPIRTLLWRDDAVLEEGVLRIGEEVYGRSVSFAAFCRRHGLKMGRLKVPDWEVVEAVREYHCPRRRRIVLRRGAVYGAPVQIQRIRYERGRHAGKSGAGRRLRYLVEELQGEKGDGSARELHEAFLASLREKARFEFDPSDDYIYLNGRRLIRGVPALILRYVLLRHLSEGKADFKSHELKETVRELLNPNFEVRLDRLMERLRENCPKVRLIRCDRGHYRFQADCPIEFTECPSGAPA